MDNSNFDPKPGVPEELEPGLRRILCPNPSPMTFRGTNTYLLGEGDIAVIDPGPALPEHMAAILAALQDKERISHILVTHSHIDHSPLAKALSDATGAKIFAYGNSFSGQSEIMQHLSNSGLTGGGEGVDPEFTPHVTLEDQETLTIGDRELKAHWTPGHFGNHLCFETDQAIFTGDIVMGWASTMVSPPDGDLTAFLASATHLAALDARIFYPGHGAPILTPAKRAEWLIAHRKSRESEILTQLDNSDQSVPDLTTAIYTDVPDGLLKAAERNVFAHLIDLHQKKLVQAKPQLSYDARFTKL